MKLSIITINRNNAAGLVRTLESTLDRQTSFDDWEQIVVDGASTDGSFAVLDKWKGNPHIGWHISEPDTGIYNAMNKGATHALGDYLLFLNSGDELLPGILTQVFKKNLESDIVYGDEIVIASPEVCWTWKVQVNDITPAFFLLSGFPHQSCFISRSLFSRMEGYDETLRIIGDTEFFLRCREDSNVSFMQLPFAIAKFYMNGVSSDPSHQAERLDERRRVMAVHFGLFASNRVASLLSEGRPWISSRVAMLAANDKSLARFLCISSSISSKLWKNRFLRFFMNGGIRFLQLVRHAFSSSSKKTVTQ